MTRIRAQVAFARALARSNYGREWVWRVEREGEVIARLTAPVQVEQFWYSYEAEMTPGVPRADLLHDDVRFFSEGEYRVEAEHAFVSPFPESHEGTRVQVRALYDTRIRPLWFRILVRFLAR